ncbi:MAG: alpha/beta hydrolase-fold protein [Acidobacteriota bacterium]
MKLSILSIIMAGLCAAQAPAPSVADRVVSPEVSGATITFRIYAPKAEKVTLNGDWMKLGTRVPLAKSDDGVWSVQAGPLEPQVYLYSFNVDGMNIADPVNPRMKLRARTSASLVEVPGTELWQLRDVPHGKVEMLTHRSKVLDGAERQVFVYTPPGYAKSKSSYPVLYLFHGSNDVAAGWTWTGNAHLILDNLIAEGKAVPMVIVMPWGHAVPFGAPREIQSKNSDLHERYVVEEVMPWIESEYRLKPGAANRAVVGLSMGGGQALREGLSNLDKFSHVGVFSSGKPGDFEARHAKVLSDAQGTNGKLKLFWIGIGTDDPALDRARALHAALEKAGVKHEYVETPGGHFYPVWRRYLSTVAPKLFR